MALRNSVDSLASAAVGDWADQSFHTNAVEELHSLRDGGGYHGAITLMGAQIHRQQWKGPLPT
jgi:hypothetical protein